MWDGKIGIWECVDMVKAKRTSHNRPAGTIEPKPYIINAKRYRTLIFDKVLPAIKARCPPDMLSKTIIIQQDNATPHSSVFTDSPELLAKCRELHINVTVTNQPLNSPDLNVLDLGLFCALQKEQYCKCPTKTLELIAQTK